MRKWQLVGVVASEASLSKAEAKKAVDAVFGAIKASLGRGETVSIERFGSFSVKERQGRIGRNPRTGEELEIEGMKVPKFKASRVLRGVVAS